MAGAEPTDTERRLDILEYSIAEIWSILRAEEELAQRAGSLSHEVKGLRVVMETVEMNRQELRHVAARVNDVDQDKLDKRYARRARIWAFALAGVVASGIAGTVFTWWQGVQVKSSVHGICVQRNTGLRTAVTRERSLARSDGPATAAAHEASAEAYEKQIVNCDP